MLPQEIIRRKRDGKQLSADEISFFIQGLTDGRIVDAQASALAMAIFFQGLDIDECASLTRAMMQSGAVLDWSSEKLHGPVLDKHSTGGVGDNVSLMLAPAVAACGAHVPMISGRGLGHTGGTLDKLDSIPGYQAQPDEALFRKVVREVGCAIIGQTSALAPADKKLYAIRDVTATVESISLITASILSKKLAAGLQGLVMDVKTGAGAFMPTLERSRDLARSIVEVARRAGLPASALITDMDQPLASAAGNAVEVVNALDYLTGVSRDARLHRVVVALGAEMLRLGKLADSDEEAAAKIEHAISSGKAADYFERMSCALGGPQNLLKNYRALLPRAPIEKPVFALRSGYVESIRTMEVGLAVVSLGGGRARPQDEVDPAVGFTALAEVGDEISPARPLGIVHARTDAQVEAAAEALRKAYRIGDSKVAGHAPVVERFGESR
jgi:thymidine phosphorylase